MSAAVRKPNKSGADPKEVGRIRRDRSLLIVEPNHLLRWSLVTYLSRWFRVFPAGSLIEANKIFAKGPVDAVVISDELGADDTDALKQKALAGNPLAKIVYVVMSAKNQTESAVEGPALEKPFELEKLARMLGVAAGSGLPRSYE